MLREFLGAVRFEAACSCDAYAIPKRHLPGFEENVVAGCSGVAGGVHRGDEGRSVSPGPQCIGRELRVLVVQAAESIHRGSSKFIVQVPAKHEEVQSLASAKIVFRDQTLEK